MQLEGSCHCGKVRFSCESRAPYPFNYCYCSICRKTAGGGGYAINLHAEHDSLELEGAEHITVYHAFVDHPDRKQRSQAERRFCKHCGSALWVWDPDWPELMHPFASVIDTPLPVPPERCHIMLESKANWVQVPEGSNEHQYKQYPGESLMSWHERHGLVTD